MPNNRMSQAVCSGKCVVLNNKKPNKDRTPHLLIQPENFSSLSILSFSDQYQLTIIMPSNLHSLFH